MKSVTFLDQCGLDWIYFNTMNEAHDRLVYRTNWSIKLEGSHTKSSFNLQLYKNSRVMFHGSLFIQDSTCVHSSHVSFDCDTSNHLDCFDAWILPT